MQISQRAARGTKAVRAARSAIAIVLLAFVFSALAPRANAQTQTAASHKSKDVPVPVYKVDPKGNLYTGEVETGKGIQKFILTNGDGKSRLHPHE